MKTNKNPGEVRKRSADHQPQKSKKPRVQSKQSKANTGGEAPRSKSKKDAVTEKKVPVSRRGRNKKPEVPALPEPTGPKSIFRMPQFVAKFIQSAIRVFYKDKIHWMLVDYLLLYPMIRDICLSKKIGYEVRHIRRAIGPLVRDKLVEVRTRNRRVPVDPNARSRKTGKPLTGKRTVKDNFFFLCPNNAANMIQYKIAMVRKKIDEECLKKSTAQMHEGHEIKYKCETCLKVLTDLHAHLMLKAGVLTDPTKDMICPICDSVMKPVTIDTKEVSNARKVVAIFNKKLSVVHKCTTKLHRVIFDAKLRRLPLLEEEDCEQPNDSFKREKRKKKKSAKPKKRAIDVEFVLHAPTLEQVGKKRRIIPPWFEQTISTDFESIEWTGRLDEIKQHRRERHEQGNIQELQRVEEARLRDERMKEKAEQARKRLENIKRMILANIFSKDCEPTESDNLEIDPITEQPVSQETNSGNDPDLHNSKKQSANPEQAKLINIEEKSASEEKPVSEKRKKHHHHHHRGSKKHKANHEQAKLSNIEEKSAGDEKPASEKRKKHHHHRGSKKHKANHEQAKLINTEAKSASEKQPVSQKRKKHNHDHPGSKKHKSNRTET